MVDCSRLLFARRLCPEGYGQLTWGGSRGRCRRYFAVQHAIGGVAICRVDLIHTDWRLPGRFTRAHDSMLLLRMHQRPLCREHPARHACPSPSRVIKPTPGHSSRGMALTTSGSPWPRHTAGTPSGRGSVFHRSRYIQSAVGSTMSQQPCPPAYRLLHCCRKREWASNFFAVPFAMAPAFGRTSPSRRWLASRRRPGIAVADPSFGPSRRLFHDLRDLRDTAPSNFNTLLVVAAASSSVLHRISTFPSEKAHPINVANLRVPMSDAVKTCVGCFKSKGGRLCSKLEFH